MTQSDQIPDNQTEAFVTTGSQITCSKKGIIKTSPLGSCVALIAYNKRTKTGGIAHIMLPGKAPTKDKTEENKYAQNAIDNLLKKLENLGNNKSTLEICLVGGANVLKRADDTIAVNLIFSIFKIIEQKKLSLKKSSLGGYERRTAKLFLHTGKVTFTRGDETETELFNFISGNTGEMSYE